MALTATLQDAEAQHPALLPEAWLTRDSGVPVARYRDREFAKLEAELFWPRVWQMACRIDQIPDPGDYVVYDILDQSVVVVRADEETVRAFHNVCPHRATALAVGSGRFQLDQIVCPFHGWKWNLRGESTFVLNQEEFKGGCLRSEDVALKEVHVRIWAGFVYVNLAKAPPSFDAHIAPI